MRCGWILDETAHLHKKRSSYHRICDYCSFLSMNTKECCRYNPLCKNCAKTFYRKKEYDKESSKYSKCHLQKMHKITFLVKNK